MKRKLRHPINSIREPFGTAGLVVAMIALVAALGGTALAAAKLNSTQKKEVTKIAKKYAGKPGAAGPAGPAGPQGPAGTNGKDGTNGTDGQDGADGTSVTGVAIPTSSATCNHLGGTAYTSASGTENVCNGQTGFTQTLPSGKTETGAWVESSTGSPKPLTAISFSIPLAASLDSEHVHFILTNGKEITAEVIEEEEEQFFVKKEVTPTACGSPVGSATEPKAQAGHLCVYTGFKEGSITPGESQSYLAGVAPIRLTTQSEEEGLIEALVNGGRGGGADTAGAVLGFSGSGQISGTFAVTAP